MNYEAVEQLLTAVMEKTGIPAESTPFDLSNDKYVEGDRDRLFASGL